MLFLEKIAQDILQEFGNDLSRLRIIFPNQRSAVLFTRYLSRAAGTTVWCPGLMSISAFIKSLSTLQVPDRLSLIFDLFETWKSHSAQEESYAQFYFWGELLLKDFDEADRWMADTESLFRSVRDQKELDEYFGALGESELEALKSFWSGIGKGKPGGTLSEEQQKFIRLWEMLSPVYHAFRKKLLEKGCAYEGLVYREVAMAPIAPDTGSDIYIFAGFNLLTKCEAEIIKKYVRDRNARIYWDLDIWYMQHEKQEAGYFLRQYREDEILGKTFPQILPDRIQQKGNIWESALPSRTSQCIAAGKKIQELIRNHGIPEEEIAVILPADDLLFPLLNALPDEVKKINITMGYPLRHTPWYSLVEYLAALQESVQIRKSGTEYWYKPVMGLLRHPLLADVHSLALADSFQSSNRIRILPDDIAGLILPEIPESEKWKLIFQARNHNSFLSGILELLRWMADHMPDEIQYYDINRDFMYQFYTQINRLNDLIISGNLESGDEGWLPLFRQILKQIKLPFSGEPLEGIQIMGVLESRNLDYKYVIILSMEEGHFPPAPDMSTFIPFNLRRAFHLPLPAWQDSAYAYYFYRLLHHAENLFLFYTPVNEGIGGAEKSRFILQVDAELELRKPKIVEYSSRAELQVSVPPVFSLHTHPELKNILKQKLEKGISPSALNSFLDCSLRFAYRYLAGITEPQIISEEIDPAQFGTVLHKSVELLYRSLGKAGVSEIAVNPKAIQSLKDTIETVIVQAFTEEIFKGLKPRWEGRNLIIRSVLQKYLEGILKADTELGDFRILETEAEVDSVLLLNLPFISDSSVSVRFFGNIDRVDITETGVRIVDYKTGKDSRQFTHLENLMTRESGKSNKAALQTLMYGWMWLNHHPEYQNSNVPVSAGLYTMREIFSGDFDFRLQQKEEGQRSYSAVEDIRVYMPELEERLGFIIADMASEAFVFQATEDVKKCEWCAYKGICGR